MSQELIVQTADLEQATQELAAVGGRPLHVLTDHLVVITIPEGVDVESIGSVTTQLPEDMDRGERLLAQAWSARFGADDGAFPALARRAPAPVVAWDAEGHTPPDRPRADPGPDAAQAVELGAPAARSTGTPTSLTLTGSVAVGVVMVSGPAGPPPWGQVPGALKHVAAAADGTVWGVNAGDKIFRRNGSSWQQVPGALKQISVGDAGKVWGVNASDKIYRWDGAGWTQVAGALKHVSVAGDGTVWGVNASDKIYRWNGSSWTQVPGALKQISVGSADQVWGVNASDEIYLWDGSGWTQVAGALKHVSVAADGSVYGVNASDKIYRLKGDGTWEQLSGQLKQISAASGSVQWGVNSSDMIFTHDGALDLELSDAEVALIMAEVIEGLQFLATAEPTANVTFVYDWREVTVDVKPGSGSTYEALEAPWRNAALQKLGHPASRDGSVAYVNALRSSRRTDWAYVAYFTKYPLHHFAYAGQERLVMHYENNGWGSNAINQVFAHETCHIFGAADEYGGCGCGGSGIYNVPNKNCVNCTSSQEPCLMNANTLSLCSWSRGQIGWRAWEQMTGALKHVAVGSDGTVWGVNADDRIYRWNGGSWTQVPGALKQISVGDAGDVWGVNADDKIYRWNGSSWTQVPGALKHVSVAGDSTVWGVNADDRIYRWNGGSWTQVAGALKQVSVGQAGLVWGVNASDKIYRWNGSGWEQVPGALKHVSVASDGTVWGVNASDMIYRREAGAWKQVPGALEQVSAGSDKLVWGVNSEDEIYRLL